MGHNISGIIKSIRSLMRGDKGVNGDAQRIEQLGWMIFLKIFDDKDIEMELLDDTYVSPIPSQLQWRNWASDDEGLTGDALLVFINTELFPTLQKLALGTTNKRAILVREVFEGNNNYMKSGTIIRQVINKLNEVNFNSSEDRHMFGDIYETILKELQSAGDSGEFYTPRAITSFITDMVDPKLGEIVFDPACGTGGFLTSAIEHIRQKEVKNIDDRLTLQKSIKGVELKPLPHMLALTNLVLHDIEVPNIEYDDALSKELSSITQKDRVDVILANPPFGGNVTDGMEMNFPMTYRTKESADLFLILIIQFLKDGGRAGIVLPDGSLTGDGVKARIRQKLLEDCNLHTVVRLPNSVFQPYASVATNLLFFTKGEPTKEVWYYEHQLPEGQKSYSKTKLIEIKEFDPIKEWWNNRVEHEQAWKVDIEIIKNSGYNLDMKNPHQKEEEHIYTASELMGMIHQSFSKSNDLLIKLNAELMNA
ncbi:N-6 DNA methylase [Sulfuricurvum sp.]|uniref:class I SAM-dependent DNA methyltransferase n=1 Tax=Sulfuricurvum sp. TaxID=2025608 RepID=UPI00286EAC6C|nr:N-6 DNA methylase [Sulfuricurvum sp.]